MESFGTRVAACVLVTALGVAGCGDGKDDGAASKSTPVVAPGLRPPPYPGAPVASYYDDARLADDVFDAAKTRDRTRLQALEIPPRASRMRVAVRAVHDLLLDERVSPPSWDDLFTALAALAEQDEALGRRLAVWKGWSESERRLEAALARRARTGMEALGGLTGAASPDLSGYASRVPEAPPESPAAARLAALRTASLALAAPSGKVDPPLTQSLARGRGAFDALEWPAEHGRTCEMIAFQVARDAPGSLRFVYFTDAALDGYVTGKDDFLAARLYLRRALMASVNDPQRAVKLSIEGMRRMEASGGRGQELAEALYRHGQLLQRSGRHREAADAFRKSVDEALWAKLPELFRQPVRDGLATSLVRSGRFQEAEHVAREATELIDAGGSGDEGRRGMLRASLDATVAVCQMQRGDHLAAAESFRLAAARFDRVAGADQSGQAARERDRHTLLCARELVLAGSLEDARRHIASVVEREGVSPSVRAAAAGVLIEAGLVDRAREQIVRAERDGGPRFAAGLAELRGRLFAASGEAERARGFFRKALQTATRDGKLVPAGPAAARILESWADLEEAEGELASAADLRLRALAHLSIPGFPVEKDRARAELARVERRRGWFRKAHTVIEARVKAKLPRTLSVGQDLLLDQFLVELELALAGERTRGNTPFAAVASKTAERIPEGPAREIAVAALRHARGVGSGDPDPPEAPEKYARFARLREVLLLARSQKQRDDRADRAIALARSLGAEEPEMRRWAARIGLEATADPERLFALVELRRRPDPATFAEVRDGLGGRESLFVIEPCGTFTVLIQMGTTYAAGKVDADAAIRGFWDAANVEPSADGLQSAALALADAVFSKLGALGETDVLCVSLAAPLGPLPFDVIPQGDGTLLDHVAVTVVTDATERVRANRLPVPKDLPLLGEPRAALHHRHVLVESIDLGPKLEDKELDRLRALFLSVRKKSASAAVALRAAKLAFRKEWKGEKRVPAWALLLLRGAP